VSIAFVGNYAVRLGNDGTLICAVTRLRACIDVFSSTRSGRIEHIGRSVLGRSDLLLSVAKRWQHWFGSSG
ncbi:hypothetical protein RZS08_34155, partial [Arthrospira platensis SPKY1]|nr:hypothetical protein [Arthrospira platensis SPKY1]